MLHIALCDDQTPELEATRALVERWLQQGNIPGIITAFCSGASLLTQVENGHTFDLFILDIIMPNENGIAIGRELRRLSRDASIIYLTSSADFALESFESYPLQYLLKPVSEGQLFRALDRAWELQCRRQDATVVHTASGELRLLVKDIQFVSLYNRKIQYHMTDGTSVESVSLRNSFSEAMEDLISRRSFLLSGSSYVVNLDHVQSVERSELIFYSGERLALPKRAHSELRIAWMKYWLGGGDAT